MAVNPTQPGHAANPNQGTAGKEPTFLSVWALRPDDLAIMVFHLVNIDLQPLPGQAPSNDPSTPGPVQQLVANDPQNAYIIIEFPAQSVGEEAFEAKTVLTDENMISTSLIHLRYRQNLASLAQAGWPIVLYQDLRLSILLLNHCWHIQIARHNSLKAIWEIP